MTTVDRILNEKKCLPNAFGPKRGIVESIEDPEGLGRLKVNVPSVGEEFITDWSPMFGFPQVDDMKPRKGDSVIVFFEGGDISFPWIQFGWKVKGQNIQEMELHYPSDDRGGNRLIKSPKGKNYVILGDGEDSNGIVGVKNVASGSYTYHRDLKDEKYCAMPAEEKYEQGRKKIVTGQEESEIRGHKIETVSGTHQTSSGDVMSSFTSEKRTDSAAKLYTISSGDKVKLVAVTKIGEITELSLDIKGNVIMKNKFGEVSMNTSKLELKRNASPLSKIEITDSGINLGLGSAAIAAVGVNHVTTMIGPMPILQGPNLTAKV